LDGASASTVRIDIYVETTTVRAAAYIRVRSKSQTLDMQRVAIERAAHTRRDTIFDWLLQRCWRSSRNAEF
jgi:hypothetical protein